MRVLSVASEAYPLVKTGGLADVVGALPGALAPHGIEVVTLVPGYPAVKQAMGRVRVLHRYTDLLGVKARLVAARVGALSIVALDAPRLFARDGGPYGDAAGRDWSDNGRRFAALGRASADLASGAVAGHAFDLLHAHDWQAAMAVAYLRLAPGGPTPPPSVLTIHNIAFQGWFEPGLFESLGLPPAAWALDGVEYYGGVGFLKAGLQAADAITTVSPTYAQEIRTPAFGMGLEGLIQARGDRVSGIVNGIDAAVWDPATDPRLAARYTGRSLERRAANKAAIADAFGLQPSEGPLFCVISRLTGQKGMDVLAGLLDTLVAAGGRLALLGSGDAALEAAFIAAAARHPGRIGVRVGYDEALSHLLQGGGDAILVPSRFEPCGLTQLYGLRYGCVPVVSRTGGLADTVVDANMAALAAGVATGFQFDGVTPDTLTQALNRVFASYARPAEWRALQRNGMRADVSWASSGARYAALYRSLVGERA